MRRFGVEIELVGLSVLDARTALNQANVPTNWKVTTDASLMAFDGGSCEVVSPILSTEEDFATLRRAALALEAAGATVNRTCGLHVHVDARGLSNAAIAQVALRYGRYEGEIDRLMPTSRRGTNNRYCQPVSPAEVQRGVSLGFGRLDRYRKVNLSAYAKHGTIEFRQHSGTCDADKIENWVRFVIAFVEATIEEVGNGQAIALSTTERTVIDHLRRSAPTQDIANALGCNYRSVATHITRLRKKGFDIVAGPGAYSIRNQPSTEANLQGLWSKVPDSVKQFYDRRAIALAR